MIRYLVLIFLPVLSSTAQIEQPIDTSKAVEIDGIQQWINIKGSNRAFPVLLFLHGGPGNSAMNNAQRFTDELQLHFIVVQWDQRETGKTAALNSSDTTLSVALMENDAVAMINYLRSYFSKDKIYLMGHSWGGFLGLTIASRHPELLNAYFAISPMVHQVESERLSLEWMILKAKLDHNNQALNDLERVSIPFGSGEQLYYHRSWLATMMGNKPPAKDFVEDWAIKWLNLFNEASLVDFSTAAPEIKCPIYFFVGRKDYQTHFKLTEDYFKALKAPKKGLFWFEDSGHNPNFTEPKKLQNIIIREILPELTK